MKTKQQIISELNVKPIIDAQAEIEKRINFLVEYSMKTNTNGFVLGISGGVDSTLAGKLAQLAVDRMNEQLSTDDANKERKAFIAVRLPYGQQQDEADAIRALEFIKPTKQMTCNIADGVDALATTYSLAIGQPLKDFHKGNMKARVRMLMQYAIAGEQNMLVIGTDQAAEAITGFFTKFGDGGADILPLSGLTKAGVRMLLQALGAAKPLSEKPPTADLLDNKPQQLDEDELGLSYSVIDQFLSNQAIDEADEHSIIERYMATEHKRKLPVTPYDDWWS